jgi:Cu/Ag efflux protein CusF
MNDEETGSGMPEQGRVVKGTGVIRVVEAGQRKLNIRHDPIEALGWPAMTMDFRLANDVDISNLAAGDNIMFDLMETNEHYQITSIHRVDDMTEDSTNARDQTP